jgi:hypothetical protein
MRIAQGKGFGSLSGGVYSISGNVREKSTQYEIFFKSLHRNGKLIPDVDGLRKSGISVI